MNRINNCYIIFCDLYMSHHLICFESYKYTFKIRDYRGHYFFCRGVWRHAIFWIYKKEKKLPSNIWLSDAACFFINIILYNKIVSDCINSFCTTLKQVIFLLTEDIIIIIVRNTYMLVWIREKWVDIVTRWDFVGTTHAQFLYYLSLIILICLVAWRSNVTHTYLVRHIRCPRSVFEIGYIRNSVP